MLKAFPGPAGRWGLEQSKDLVVHSKDLVVHSTDPVVHSKDPLLAFTLKSQKYGRPSYF